MKRMNLIAAVAASAGVASMAAASNVTQINPIFNPVRADVTAGAFPIGGGTINGTLSLSQVVAGSTNFQINTAVGGPFFPGFTVQSIVATISIVNNNVSAASFDILMNDGSGFTASGGTSPGTDLIWENGSYNVRGSISNFLLSGPLLAGVDVSAAFNAQPLLGSFFNFSFTPNTQAGGIGSFDETTQLVFDVHGVIIPLPSAAGLAGVGLLGLASVRRRRAL